MLRIWQADQRVSFFYTFSLTFGCMTGCVVLERVKNGRDWLHCNDASLHKKPGAALR